MTRRTKSARNEKALRKMLEAHRGDVSLCESKPEPAKVGAQRGSIVFSLRFSPSELDDLRLQAETRGISVSEMIRKAALEWGQTHRYQVIVHPQPTVEVSISRTRSISVVKQDDQPGRPVTGTA